MSKLDIFEDTDYDDVIIKEEYHTYHPLNNNYENSDEVHFIIHNQDTYTTPADSFIYVEGKVIAPTDTFKFTNNPVAFLLEEVRYLLNGVEIDRVRDVGITTTMKGLVSYDSNQSRGLNLAGWGPLNNEQIIYNVTKKTFYCCIPLSFMLGFAEDYKRIVVNARQELILLRSRTDLNAYQDTGAAPPSSDNNRIQITKMEWKMPHVWVNDETRLQLLTQLSTDRPLSIAFRRWELHELPAMKNSDKDVWTVKTSTNLERPRYVIVAFQTGRKNNVTKDASRFDHVNIRNIRVHLNSQQVPHYNLNLDITNGNYALVYQAYVSFTKSYYHQDAKPAEMDYASFLKHMVYVFDCSKQGDVVKSSTVDLKIEAEAHNPYPLNTSAYCLILYDSLVEYTPLTSVVRRVQ